MIVSFTRTNDGAAGSFRESRVIARRATAVVALLVFFSAPAFADGKVSASLQGPSIYDGGYQYDSDPEVVGLMGEGQSGDRRWRGWAVAAKSEATSEMNVYANIVGTSLAYAKAQAMSTSIRYVLHPPAGARLNSGKIAIYGGVAGVDIEGNASLRVVLDVEARQGAGVNVVNYSDRTIKEQPGTSQSGCTSRWRCRPCWTRRRMLNSSSARSWKRTHASIRPRTAATMHRG